MIDPFKFFHDFFFGRYILCCEPATIFMVTTAVAGGMQAYSQNQEGKSAAKMYQYKAALARQEALAAKQVSAKNISIIQDKAAQDTKSISQEMAQTLGAQKASAGAMGVSGTTLANILTGTVTKGSMDKLAIRYNAELESWKEREETKQKVWKLESEAGQYDVAASNAKKAGKRAAATTLLSTAASMAMVGMKLTPTKPDTSGAVIV